MKSWLDRINRIALFRYDVNKPRHEKGNYPLEWVSNHREYIVHVRKSQLLEGIYEVNMCKLHSDFHASQIVSEDTLMSQESCEKLLNSMEWSIEEKRALKNEKKRRFQNENKATTNF